MIRFEPSLIVTRLVIERQGATVYDEAFHAGVNVVRGENSTGKSTILNFIFYGLGGDLSDWSEAALNCSRVMIEVMINGRHATLSREISTTAGRPMEIFGGTFDQAIEAPRNGWIRYPYRRTENIESFSQALFRLFGIPEVANELSGNITIHQVLRLLYADQLSPVDALFRFDRFDSPNLRDAVGRLVCGLYDNKLYANDLEIRDLGKEFDQLATQLSGLFSVLGKSGEALTRDWLNGTLAQLLQQKDAVNEEIRTLEREMFIGKEREGLSLNAQTEAYSVVQHLQAEISEINQRRDALAFTIADSNAFIEGLKSKLAALEDTSLVVQEIGIAEFQACPACLSPIKQTSAKEICYLCKTPLDVDHVQSRVVATINEAAIQIKQSGTLQRDRAVQLEKLNRLLAERQRQWKFAARRLEELQRRPSSELQGKVRSLYGRAGYIDREIQDLESKGRVIDLIDEIATRKSAISAKLDELRTENKRLRSALDERLSVAYATIENEILGLLRKDLPREPAFSNPQVVQFDFGANRITVDGQSYFSASSRVVLKSSFIFSLFVAATKLPFFRHPRFVMIDTTEDKGMEPERSHNFQTLMARFSSECEVEHQIIYATAMIAPDLENELYTVGTFSTHEQRTLSIPAVVTE